VRLCDESVGSGRLVPPGRWENTDGLVVARETVDTGLDENETELAVLVLAVALEVLADSDSLWEKRIVSIHVMVCRQNDDEKAQYLPS